MTIHQMLVFTVLLAFVGMPLHASETNTDEYANLRAKLNVVHLPDDPSAASARAYLNAVLHAGDGLQILKPNSPLVDKIAEIPPEMFGLLLERREDFEIPAVIKWRAKQYQRQIIASLPDHPFLIETVLREGWADEAKQQVIEAITNHPQTEHFSLIEAGAKLDTPQLYEPFVQRMSRSSYAARDLLKLIDKHATKTRQMYDADVARLYRDFMAKEIKHEGQSEPEQSNPDYLWSMSTKNLAIIALRFGCLDAFDHYLQRELYLMRIALQAKDFREFEHRQKLLYRTMNTHVVDLFDFPREQEIDFLTVYEKCREQFRFNNATREYVWPSQTVRR